ncbi:MAG: LssY C-terminal domain-containing protein, partial [Bryobacteraceae bacterium]
TTGNAGGRLDLTSMSRTRRDIWIGAATHDIAMRLRDSGHTFTHRIDPMIDLERSKVIDALAMEGCAAEISMVDRTQASQPTARDIVTDGRLAFIKLKQCDPTDHESVEIHANQPRTAGGRFISRLVLEGRHAILRGNIYYWGYRLARRACTPVINSWRSVPTPSNP